MPQFTDMMAFLSYLNESPRAREAVRRAMDAVLFVGPGAVETTAAARRWLALPHDDAVYTIETGAAMLAQHILNALLREWQ